MKIKIKFNLKVNPSDDFLVRGGAVWARDAWIVNTATALPIAKSNHIGFRLIKYYKK